MSPEENTKQALKRWEAELIKEELRRAVKTHERLKKLGWFQPPKEP